MAEKTGAAKPERGPARGRARRHMADGPAVTIAAPAFISEGGES
ncbi:hypothetical protein [Hansschlegelia zhihuaiae]|nr:hypothetical protein [Hansschlegelia zhihuaiae]